MSGERKEAVEMIVIDAAVETGGVGDDVNLTHIVDNKM